MHTHKKRHSKHHCGLTLASARHQRIPRDKSGPVCHIPPFLLLRKMGTIFQGGEPKTQHSNSGVDISSRVTHHLNRQNTVMKYNTWNILRVIATLHLCSVLVHSVTPLLLSLCRRNPWDSWQISNASPGYCDKNNCLCKDNSPMAALVLVVRTLFFHISHGTPNMTCDGI